MAKTFTLLSVVTSKSTGEKYEIRRGSDEAVYCTCKGWQFSRSVPKSCKHLRAYHDDVVKVPAGNWPFEPPTLAGKYQNTGTVATAPTKPALAPYFAEAQAMFLAMCEQATKKVAARTNVAFHISVPAQQVMIDVLASRLALFAPTPTPVAMMSEATPGVRMITLED